MVTYRYKLTGNKLKTEIEQNKLYENGCRVKKNTRRKGSWVGGREGREHAGCCLDTLLGNGRILALF